MLNMADAASSSQGKVEFDTSETDQSGSEQAAKQVEILGKYETEKKEVELPKQQTIDANTEVESEQGKTTTNEPHSQVEFSATKGFKTILAATKSDKQSWYSWNLQGAEQKCSSNQW